MIDLTPFVTRTMCVDLPRITCGDFYFTAPILIAATSAANGETFAV